MSKILCILFVSLIMAASCVYGYYLGDKAVRTDVFKNCLAATLAPAVCLQYMKMIKNKEYKRVNNG